MLKGKNVILGVTGSIAAYKIASLASSLVKLNCNVDVIMTQNAVNFINPITFETLTGNKCIVDTFDRNFQYSVEHVALAKKADVFLVAPATANFLAKAAYGMADDMLTTTFLACKCPKIIAPAMNTNMYENEIVQENIKTLKSHGYQVIDPASGHVVIQVQERCRSRNSCWNIFLRNVHVKRIWKELRLRLLQDLPESQSTL